MTPPISAGSPILEVQNRQAVTWYYHNIAFEKGERPIVKEF